MGRIRPAKGVMGYQLAEDGSNGKELSFWYQQILG